MRTLAGNLKWFIGRSGKTQREVADAVGITEVSLSRYVNGIRVPKAPLIVKIADAIHCDVEDILDFEEDSMTVQDALKELASLTVDYGRRSEKQIAKLDRAIDMAIAALEEKA